MLLLLDLLLILLPTSSSSSLVTPLFLFPLFHLISFFLLLCSSFRDPLFSPLLLPPLQFPPSCYSFPLIPSSPFSPPLHIHSQLPPTSISPLCLLFSSSFSSSFFSSQTPPLPSSISFPPTQLPPPPSLPYLSPLSIPLSRLASQVATGLRLIVRRQPFHCNLNISSHAAETAAVADVHARG